MNIKYTPHTHWQHGTPLPHGEARRCSTCHTPPPPSTRSHMKTLVIHKLGAMKFTAQNRLHQQHYSKRVAILIETEVIIISVFPHEICHRPRPPDTGCRSRTHFEARIY